MRYLTSILITLFIVSACNLNGPPLIQGLAGPQGPSGNDGISIVQTVIPATTSQCSNGGYNVLMAQDTDDTGTWAPNDLNQTAFVICNGLNGTNGTNATPVTMVQFCKNYVTAYPSSFPEYGICDGSNLWAVYWDSKNAWLAEVVPGQYLSTSTSAPCDFTVSLGCNVSN